MWYPLTNDQVKNHFAELRQQVLTTRFKSRSKHKAHDDNEYEWGLGIVIFFDAPSYSIFDVISGLAFSQPQEPGVVSASLTQRWKGGPNTRWSVIIPGPDNGGFKNPDGLKKLLAQFGVK